MFPGLRAVMTPLSLDIRQRAERPGNGCQVGSISTKKFGRVQRQSARKLALLA